jgi:hypothetical protein
MPELSRYLTAGIANKLTDQSPRASQPSWITAPMRQHQLTLLHAAERLEESVSYDPELIGTRQLMTQYGVLADRVGAGKSLVALGLICAPPPRHTTLITRESGAARIMEFRRTPDIQDFRPEWHDLSNNALAATLFPTRISRWHTRTALVIVPHTIISQWETYITEQTTLNAAIVRRARDCDPDSPNFIQRILTADLVVCSCTMLRRWIVALSSYKNMDFWRIVWSRVFVDEADSIRCTLRTTEISARFYWFITGSWANMLFPGGLSYGVSRLASQTPYRDMFSAEALAIIGDVGFDSLPHPNNLVAQHLASSLDPIYTTMILRNHDDWVNASLRCPIIHTSTVVCSAPANLTVLRDYISPAAMECLHAGDTTGALTVLGLNTTSAESLTARVTESLHRDLEQAEKILEFKQSMEYSTPANKAVALEKAAAKVSRIRDQLTSLTTRIASISTATCPICFDTPRSATLTPCCRQAFCLACLCECIQKKPACPLCRNSIRSVKELTVIGEGEDDSSEMTVEKAPTKGAALLKLLSESKPTDRILVFSAYEASFSGIRDVLTARGIPSELLSGASTRIDRLCRKFREGDIRVLYMNARHVGAGLNLDAATHVVLYHRMNSELEKQVIGRAVRFERTADLRVTYLVHDQETVQNAATGGEVIVHV